MVSFLLWIEAMLYSAKFCMMLKAVTPEQKQKLNKTREKIQPKKVKYERKLTLLVILLDGLITKDG